MANENLNLHRLLNTFIRDYMKDVFTCIPGHVLAFNPAEQLAQVQIGIQKVLQSGEIKIAPPIIDVPVLFIGDQYAMETAIRPKCEGLVFFSQRCVDGWLNTGGVAANPIGRFFDMSDAFFVPGFRPIPKALKNFSNNGLKLRNAAASQRIWLKEDNSIELTNGNGTITVKPSGDVVINGAVIDTKGRITASEVTANGIVLTSHVHGGVKAGESSTGGPQ